MQRRLNGGGMFPHLMPLPFKRPPAQAGILTLTLNSNADLITQAEFFQPFALKTLCVTIHTPGGFAAVSGLWFCWTTRAGRGSAAGRGTCS